MTRLTPTSLPQFKPVAEAVKMFETSHIRAVDDERAKERRRKAAADFGMAFMFAVAMIGFIMLVATPNEMWGW